MKLHCAAAHAIIPHAAEWARPALHTLRAATTHFTALLDPGPRTVVNSAAGEAGPPSATDHVTKLAQVRKLGLGFPFRVHKP